MDKDVWYIYTIYYYLTIKKEKKNLAIPAIGTDLKGIMLSEKKSRRKNTVYHIYVESKK